MPNPTTSDPESVLVSPREREVFQRDWPAIAAAERSNPPTRERASAPGTCGTTPTNEGRGSGRVRVMLRARSPRDGLTVRVMDEQGRALVDGPLATRVNALRAGVVHAGHVVVPAGGWYALEVLRDGSRIARVERFGVGEVFVVSGQSNSSNYGEERFGALDDRVSSFDGKHWSLACDPMPGAQDTSVGGSPWPLCGSMLRAALDVPVAFALSGCGGTSIREWQHDAFAERDGRRIVLFDALAQRVEALRHFRALLWHQGESDAYDGMDTERYIALFQRLKHALIDVTGVDSAWMVANTTFVPSSMDDKPGDVRRANQAQLRRAQQELWSRGIALEGPDTDDLLGDMRHSQDGIHFSKRGLEVHAQRWFERLLAQFFAESRPASTG